MKQCLINLSLKDILGLFQSNKGKYDNEYNGCTSSYCCSKYVHCGKTNEDCHNSKGCQSEYDECIQDTKSKLKAITSKLKTIKITITTTTVTTSKKLTSINKEKCGKDYDYHHF
ncbi:hypothetical protein BCR32DRAFT_270724 [Anaeromyces robustus]|uniref:Chitin-binding type-1 domain-containing protein n=1 Tax=Anaeromyces robustus TaxID=1754192 RepID=A0A1Y1WW04_9FUNG|nr:hypothetical protein BCR32DRAFT_270724 [Anaeromyces robustus]|eukprot:ORX77304.1 hypothetical protein BCR32DRAFT_270724 [Anaeromyces robustus]